MEEYAGMFVALIVIVGCVVMVLAEAKYWDDYWNKRNRK